MRKKKTRRTRSPVKPTSLHGLTKKVRNGVAAPYMAYAVAADGSRQLLDARCIVVDLGGAEVEIDLIVAHPILVGQLAVAARGDGLLIVGHADASSIHVGVESSRGGRLKPS